LRRIAAPAMLDELAERAAKPGHRDLAVGVKGRQQLVPAALVAIEPPGLDQLGAGEFVFQTHFFPDSQVVWANKFLNEQVSWTNKRMNRGAPASGPVIAGRCRRSPRSRQTAPCPAPLHRARSPISRQ